MLLDILVITGALEKAIGNSARISFSSYGEDVFPNKLKITVEWIVERQLIRLEEVIPATELERSSSDTNLEALLLEKFVEKAKRGYANKLQGMRTRIEQEIRNASKPKY